MSELLSSMPDSMLIRKQTVEHPFGTIKSWMGSTHFLTKRLKNVSTVMSLHVLAYNLRRMMSILVPEKLIAAMVTGGFAQQRNDRCRRVRECQRPTAGVAGEKLVGQLIDLVEIWPLLPVDFDVHERVVHHCRGGRILEGFVRHDVAPMAG